MTQSLFGCGAASKSSTPDGTAAPTQPAGTSTSASDSSGADSSVNAIIDPTTLSNLGLSSGTYALALSLFEGSQGSNGSGNSLALDDSATATQAGTATFQYDSSSSDAIQVKVPFTISAAAQSGSGATDGNIFTIELQPPSGDPVALATEVLPPESAQNGGSQTPMSVPITQTSSLDAQMANLIIKQIGPNPNALAASQDMAIGMAGTSGAVTNGRVDPTVAGTVIGGYATQIPAATADLWKSFGAQSQANTQLMATNCASAAACTFPPIPVPPTGAAMSMPTTTPAGVSAAFAGALAAAPQVMAALATSNTPPPPAAVLAAYAQLGSSTGPSGAGDAVAAMLKNLGAAAAPKPGTAFVPPTPAQLQAAQQAGIAGANLSPEQQIEAAQGLSNGGAPAGGGTDANGSAPAGGNATPPTSCPTDQMLVAQSPTANPICVATSFLPPGTTPCPSGQMAVPPAASSALTTPPAGSQPPTLQCTAVPS